MLILKSDLAEVVAQLYEVVNAHRELATKLESQAEALLEAVGGDVGYGAELLGLNPANNDPGLPD